MNSLVFENTKTNCGNSLLITFHSRCNVCNAASTDNTTIIRFQTTRLCICLRVIRSISLKVITRSLVYEYKHMHCFVRTSVCVHLGVRNTIYHAIGKRKVEIQEQIKAMWLNDLTQVTRVESMDRSSSETYPFVSWWELVPQQQSEKVFQRTK